MTEKEKLVKELGDLKIHQLCAPRCCLGIYASNEQLGDIADFILAYRNSVLDKIDSCVTEEINLKNYDHETICRVSSMWDNALQKIAKLKGE